MRTLKKFLALSSLLAGFALPCLQSHAQKLIPLPSFKEIWVQDYPPFRLVGNLYYVGTYDLASYLITTPKGHILINTGIPGSDTMIRKHVEALGFKFTDIRILLATHAHFDHVGALAAIKAATGAKLMIGAGDAPVLADGGNSDFIFGGKGPIFQPVKADRLLYDKDTIELDGMKVIALHHPGHTKGACSLLFTVKDEHRSYVVLITNFPSILDATIFPSMPAYPDVGRDYAYTLDTMPKIKFDLWFGSHASQFDLQSKHKPGDPYNPEAFANRAGYDSSMVELKKEYIKRSQP
jgi:metallo-beta-lactamase class B